MYEKEKRQTNTLPEMREGLEYIAVCSDPGRVQVSGMQKNGAIIEDIHRRIERQETLFDVMDKIGSVLGIVACMAMCYLLIRISYGVLW